MKRQLLALILLCSLLTGCGAKPVTLAPAEDSAPAIAYVPLDDRPDNVERVVYLAESLGYTLLMPETDDYRTRLSGQPLNENGTQSGDRADLYEWVLARGGRVRPVHSLYGPAALRRTGQFPLHGRP